ncbi:PAS domain-containing hybrid sensor histidine kinase/response regulator [Hymenobacter lapidarius]|uniref:PAS domain-containing hybrid sensor histidine kinase/response regulator n=1 Tax=Hymenobacter lapidarius TaxID=1908237 RepID=UPI0008A123DA|nr:PAS domain-containing hybrid sensor histidine kinase/response regulator [Hymenobacter lapidarius]
MRPRFSRRAAVPAVRRVAAHVARTAASGTVPAVEGGGSTAPLFGNGSADRVPLILFSYDVEHQHLLHCNRHCHTVLGYSSQELLSMGQALGETMLHADSLAQFQRNDLHHVLTGNRALTWDCRLRHRDGGWRWLRIRLRASVFGPDGQVREIMGSAEDVTRHRAAVESLRQSRHLLRQVVDLVPNLIYIYDLREERNTYSNQRIEQFLGISSAELLEFREGTLLPSIVPDDTLAQLRAHFQEVAQLPDGETLALEFAVQHRNGTTRWLRSAHTPFARDAQGQVTSIIGVAEDVTERRATDAQGQAAADKLAEQHRLFHQVIDALPHPIYLKDGHGNYLLANRTMAALYGMTPDELVRYGEANTRVEHGPETDRYLSQDQQVLATGRDLTLEECYTYPDGQVAWFSSVKRLFVRSDGTAQVLGVDSNITELKLMQQALESAVGEAEVDAQAKQDFLANMSHEIRTPLHGILGLTGVLAKTTLSRSQHDYLHLLSESAEHLLTVLNDVLTTARLGAGKLRAEAQPFSPEDLLMGCAALLRPRAREKGLRMRVEKPTNLPRVLGDAHRLRQVLLNLVSNAIKFTATGQVLLRCRRVPAPARHAEPAGTVWLQFTVNDTGVGIAPETLDKVFEPFAQATASTDREYGGSGLGLSISEGLVALMGGVLRVSSELGGGSTFAFTLAFAPVPEAAPASALPLPAAPEAPAVGRVLLVEDNMVNSLLAETVLRNWGWQVTTAASGLAAIQLFEQRPFDLVLMDIQMPGMDGETAARALREHPDAIRAATPVIALTARAQAGEAERLAAAGFAGYLAKPYREEQLLQAMQAVLARHTTHTTSLLPLTLATMSSATPSYDLSNVRQLVRGDEAIVRRLAWAFIETTPAILTALDEALTKPDWEAVGDAAHHLKSSLDGLGVESLRHTIREVEAYGATPPAPEQAAEQVAQVRAVTEQVMAELRQEFPEQP